MISWQRGKTAPLGVFAMAKSLSCATHVKSLSRHKVLQIDAAVDAAPWPFMAAPVAVEERNLHRWVNSGHSPYENGDYIVNDDGGPMDFISAQRFLEAEYQEYLRDPVVYRETSDGKESVPYSIDPETRDELPF